ncbi:MAG: CDP-alcohol phosphatidyltransferase family protein [Steroidobacteraceae bacterium]
MPTPGGAGVIAAIVHFTNGDPIAYWWVAMPWCALILAVAFLMVSTWRYPSFKDIDFTRQHTFRKILLVAILFAAILYYSEVVLFFIALAYMLSGVLSRFSFAVRRRPPSPSPPQAAGL